MDKYIGVLKRCGLFFGLDDGEILSSLNCLGARVKSFQKGAVVFGEGDSPRFTGVVLSGEVSVQKMDYYGNSNIISTLLSGGVVAAAACYSTKKKLPFDVVFASSGKLLCLDLVGVIRPCQKSCMTHTRIIENLLGTIADSNIRLTSKIDILTRRSIREKLLAFLYAESKKTPAETNPSPQKGRAEGRSARFVVPFSRQQMADYLSVDRSALSRELSFMKDDNILDFDGNTFWFLT